MHETKRANGSKKWLIVLIEAKVVPNPGAQEVGNFLKSTFHRHGCHQSILAENGKAFISDSHRFLYSIFDIL